MVPLSKVEVVLGGPSVSMEENLYGLWRAARAEINLGQLSANCLADAEVCKNFAVSFLFKISETIAENKRVDAIHPIPVTNENSLPASMCTTIFLITWVLQLWLAGKTRRK